MGSHEKFSPPEGRAPAPFAWIKENILDVGNAVSCDAGTSLAAGNQGDAIADRLEAAGRCALLGRVTSLDVPIDPCTPDDFKCIERVTNTIPKVQELFDKAMAESNCRRPERAKVCVYTTQDQTGLATRSLSLYLVPHDDGGQLDVLSDDTLNETQSEFLRVLSEAISIAQRVNALHARWDEESVPHRRWRRPVRLMVAGQQSLDDGCVVVETSSNQVLQSAMTIFDQAEWLSGLQIEIGGNGLEIPNLLPIKSISLLPVAAALKECFEVADVMRSDFNTELLQPKDTPNSNIANIVELDDETLLSGLIPKIGRALKCSPSRKPEKSTVMEDLAGLRVETYVMNYYPPVTSQSRKPRKTRILKILSVDPGRTSSPKHQLISPWGAS